MLYFPCKKFIRAIAIAARGSSAGFDGLTGQVLGSPVKPVIGHATQVLIRISVYRGCGQSGCM